VIRETTGVNVLERLEHRWDRAIAAGRRRSKAFDHFWRAEERYAEVVGGRLAAAIAYYGFFAVFALALVGYAVFGFVLQRNGAVQKAVVGFLSSNLPWLQLENIERAVDGIKSTGGPIGIVGLVGLALTGIGWIEAIRSSQRALYRLKQQPGNLVVRRLVDILVLLAVFIGLAISVAAIDLLKSLLRFVAGPGTWLTVVSAILVVPVNMVLAVGLLGAVPRLRISPRRLVAPVLLVASGFTLLNSVGRYYIQRIGDNPAYAVVATAVGVLVYLYLFNQIMLWGAAIAATDFHGYVVDLAADAPPPKPTTAVAKNQDLRVSGTGGGDDGPVGALVTLQLPDDSPVIDLPWIITFGPLSDDEDWEPVVSGPYERAHALALASSVVSDDELMAVVEPLLPHVSVGEIRGEIAAARLASDAESVDDLVVPDAATGEGAEPLVREDAVLAEDDDVDEQVPEPPTEEQVRQGFARIAAKLTTPPV
jgi:membrane protein